MAMTREQNNERRRQRRIDDPEYRERARESSRKAVAKLRAKDPERAREYQRMKNREYYHKDPASSVRRYLRRKYGLTPKQHEVLIAGLMERQNGVCAICRRSPADIGKPLRLDHSHTTGVFRGLLCDNCNLALGLMRDSLAVLRAAESYVEAAGG